ncbi:TSL-kinase interacting protein 1 [Quercus lobata]|uniref:TSL-kinase interacting protein 1 n=1 Tax=Quercus lobata TaxID=97700 RepID=A0A7N2LYW9_QUELO|nr:TSL-kinase interacting protein 1 [Quercus lobata]
MNMARQRTKKTDKAPSKRIADVGQTGAKKSAKRTGGQSHKPAGQSEEFLVKSDNQSPLSSTAVERHTDFPDERRFVSEKTKRSPLLELYPGQSLLPSAKIKLQLFPIDEGTCVGLEKDGYHPYLELTLSVRKKISSVLKHLNSKWGGSSITQGEPILFPYNILEKQAGHRGWTLNDNDICAGDVYESIGRPAIFRLRYGWLCSPVPKTFGKLSTSMPFSQSEGTLKSFSTNMESTYGIGRQFEDKSEEFKENNVIEVAAAVVAEKIVNGPVDLVDNEPRIDDGLGQSSALWVDSQSNISIGGLLSEASIQGKFKNFDPITDCLPNISIGGLLSEASLQGKSDNCDPNSLGSNAGLQQTQPICDSFDAYIAAQINCPQGPRLSTQDSHSSILDAEETCHAFPCKKFSSSGKDVLPLSGSVFTADCSQDASSNSSKFPKTQVNNQAGFTHDHARQESETDLLLCSRTYNDESSLGLSGIKWTDSRGPFDLGLPISQKLISGDSISIGRFVR